MEYSTVKPLKVVETGRNEPRFMGVSKIKNSVGSPNLRSFTSFEYISHQKTVKNILV